MSLVLHCKACGRKIEIAPAVLYGPPATNGKAQEDHLCRTCYKRIKNLYPSLRSRACGDHEGRTFHGRALQRPFAGRIIPPKPIKSAS